MDLGKWDLVWRTWRQQGLIQRRTMRGFVNVDYGLLKLMTGSIPTLSSRSTLKADQRSKPRRRRLFLCLSYGRSQELFVVVHGRWPRLWEDNLFLFYGEPASKDAMNPHMADEEDDLAGASAFMIYPASLAEPSFVDYVSPKLGELHRVPQRGDDYAVAHATNSSSYIFSSSGFVLFIIHVMNPFFCILFFCIVSLPNSLFILCLWFWLILLHACSNQIKMGFSHPISEYAYVYVFITTFN